MKIRAATRSIGAGGGYQKIILNQRLKKYTKDNFIGDPIKLDKKSTETFEFFVLKKHTSPTSTLNLQTKMSFVPRESRSNILVDDFERNIDLT